LSECTLSERRFWEHLGVRAGKQGHAHPKVQTADPRLALEVGFLIAVIVVIQLALPDELAVGPIPAWAIPVIEVIGLPAGLLITRQLGVHPRRIQTLIGLYLGFLVLASVVNAASLFISLLEGDQDSADYLLFAGFGVLVINVLSFALVYWWVDAGGPVARLTATNDQRDFLYPQQGWNEPWQPKLADYCFTAYTNIIAFSPTDTMPLTHRAKFMFTVQSSVSLVTVLVVLSRAINLIP